MPKKRRIAVMMDLEQLYKRHIGTFAGIYDYAHTHDRWHLITNEWADEMLPSRADAPSPYDGLIGRITPLGARRAKRLGMPVVNVHYSTLAEGLPGVFIDMPQAGRLLVEHLLARGFRDLAFHNASDRAGAEQSDAFEQAAIDARCTYHLTTLNSGKQNRMGRRDLSSMGFGQWKAAMRQLDSWMDQWRLPTGVYIYNVPLARLVIEKCADRGWRIPDDVAIIAGWNDEAPCLRPAQSITSVEVPNEKIGYEAARMLDALLDEKEGLTPVDKMRPKTILLPPMGIVARQSTDFFAVDDLVVRKAMGYMDQNLHRPIAIDDIAEGVGVSRVTLTTRFREKLGRSVHDELKRLRIERVKRELISTSTPISKIARGIGYSSVRSLTPLFRKMVGCTPGEYRKGEKGSRPERHEFKP